MYKDYKALFNFLGGAFVELMYLEGLSKDDLIKEYRKSVQQYKNDCTQSKLSETIKEAEEVRAEIKKHWKDISYLTNIYFENEKAAAAWLDKVIGYLKA